MNLLLKLKLATLAKAIARDGPTILECIALAIARNKADEHDEEAARILATLARWAERNPDALEDALRDALGVDR